MKRLSSLFLLLMLLALQAKGQTVPPAQTLPYSENFNTLPHTSTALPTGWVSHNYITMTAGGSAGTTTNNLSISIKRLAHLLAEQMVGIRF
jgi:hypothetical protein